MTLSSYNYQQKIDDILSTGKKKSYFVAAVTVFFILLMSFAGIIPALSSLGTQHEENAKRDEIITKMQTKLDTLKKFVKDDEEKKTVLAFLKNVFPEKFAEKYALHNLIDLVENNKLGIKGYGFQNVLSGEEELQSLVSYHTQIMSVTMTGAGTLSDLQKFVKDLESSSRIFNIKEAAISRMIGNDLEESESGKNFLLSINLNIYLYNPNAVDPNLPVE